MSGNHSGWTPPLIDKVTKCRVLNKRSGKYIVRCMTERFGRHEYMYALGDDRMWRNEEKSLLLGVSAIATIEAQIKTYEDTITRIAADERYTKLLFEVPGMFVWYKTRGKNFDALCVLRCVESGDSSELFENADFDELSNWFSDRFRKDSPWYHSPVWYPRLQDDLDANPLYQAIAVSGDRTTQMNIKHSIGALTDADLDFLTALDGQMRLHALPEDYNQYFAVDADTVDFSLLSRSGYHWVHRSNFAMTGSTRQAVSLNPHTKSAVDAAHREMEFITFEKYLSMFGPNSIVTSNKI